MGVSTNGGTPIAGWFMENPNLKWMMTGGYHHFRNPHTVNGDSRWKEYFREGMYIARPGCRNVQLATWQPQCGGQMGAQLLYTCIC